MTKEKSDVKKIILSSLAVLVLVIAVIGISYAIWSRTFHGEKENSLKTGTVSFSYIESETNHIYITDALPISDENGKKLSGDETVFDFTVSGSYGRSGNIFYDVYATPYEQTLPSEYVKVYMTDQNDSPVDGYRDDTKEVPTYASLNDYTEEESKILYSSVLTDKENSKNLRLRVWLSKDFNPDEDKADQSLTFAFKVNVKARV